MLFLGNKNVTLVPQNAYGLQALIDNFINHNMIFSSQIHILILCTQQNIKAQSILQSPLSYYMDSNG